MKTGRSGGSRHSARATTRCEPSKACDQLSHQDNDWTGSYSKKYWRSRQVTFTFLTSPHVETSMEIRRPGTTLATRQTSLRRWARRCCPRSCIRPIWHGSTSTSHASIPPRTTTSWSSSTGCGTRTEAGAGSAAGTPFSTALRLAGRPRSSEWPPRLPSGRIMNRRCGGTRTATGR
jgi:hypothetical protein